MDCLASGVWYECWLGFGPGSRIVAIPAIVPVDVDTEAQLRLLDGASGVESGVGAQCGDHHLRYRSGEGL